MATQAATPESISTPTHRPPGLHTWFQLEGSGRGHGARAVLAGWGATGFEPLARGLGRRW
eukprot:813414-Pleurochrysis_carterae.AAC.1